MKTYKPTPLKEIIARHRMNYRFAKKNSMKAGLIIWEDYRFNNKKLNDIVEMYGMNNNKVRYKIIAKMPLQNIEWPAPNPKQNYGKWADCTLVLKRVK